jgi:hypothetical protein
MRDRNAVAWSASVAAILVMVSGCGDYPESDFTTMCQDSSYVRIDDDRCERGESGSSVMFISTGSDYHAPPVGSRIDQSKIVKTLPAGKTVQKAAIPKTGGIVKSSPGITRGGFGSVSGGSSGS